MKDFSMSSLVAGFMLGAIAVGIWTLSGSLSLSQTVSLSDTRTSKLQPESGAISVANQPAGSEVVIESVTVPPPGVWVAIREVGANDLGNVLGAARVNGPHTFVTVPLLRPTQAGLSYAVELYRDDGGEAFDLANDSVYIDFATGAPVISYFTTTN